MDPNATMKELNHAMRIHDREAIGVAADAMVGWLETGGFLPELCGWMTDLTPKQLTGYMRDIRAIAEMA